MTVRIVHHSGFFSCCSIRMEKILMFFDKEHVLPTLVDTSEQFVWYKVKSNNDVTFEYFDHYNNYSQVDYVHPMNFDGGNEQYKDYTTVKYSELAPFIKKYFSPSSQITSTIKYLETKYNLLYDKICVLYYRGNDKSTETLLSNYDDYILYAKQILSKDPVILFLIQSDETEFIEKMQAAFPDNSFYMKEEIRHIQRCVNTVDRVMRTDIDKFSKFYLAITIIMSKCKYIICGTGNCSYWIMLYRGNAHNIIQFNNNQWLINILLLFKS